MSNFQDKLKSSQGSGSGAPQLSIAYRVDIKEVNGQAEFTTYNKDTKVNDVIDHPIEGILIGEAMQMSSYSDDLGSKGGNYQSSYYFTNADPMVLFAPSAKGYEIVKKGKAAEIEEYLVANSTAKIAKKRRVLFVLNESGLIAVTTNLTISIDQKKGIADKLTTHMIQLVPKTYGEDTPISATAKKWLGKFIQRNPPKMAWMTLGEAIEQEIWDAWEGDRYTDEFTAFKKFKSAGGAEEKQEEEPTNYNKTANQIHTPGKVEPNANAEKVYTNASEPSDDLPF